MMVVLVIVIFLWCNFVESKTDKIVQVHVLSRHCDRVPFFHRTIPKDPVNWREKLDMDFQELTALGQHECHELGVKLRQRYLDPTSPNFIDEINPHYRGYDYHFESSDTNRTMRTCYSIGMGLFPIGTGRTVDVMPGVCALPNCSQPIPIRTILQADNDPILRGFFNCETYQKLLLEELTNDDGYHNKYDSDAKWINELFGFSGKEYIPLEHWDIMFDLINCQKDHNLLNNVPGFNESVYQKITEIKNEFCAIQFRRSITKTQLGGNFVRLVMDGMNKFVNNVTHFKYKQYCAHDMTVLGIASALGLTMDNPIFQQQPGYGTSIIFELHQTTDDDDPEKVDYYVKLVFLFSFESEFVEVQLGQTVGSCPKKCPYDEFVKICGENCVSSPKEFCDYCDIKDRNMCIPFYLNDNKNEKKETNENENEKIGLIVASSVGGVFVIISIVMTVLCCFLAVIICVLLVVIGILLTLKIHWNKRQSIIVNSDEESKAIFGGYD